MDWLLTQQNETNNQLRNNEKPAQVNQKIQNPSISGTLSIPYLLNRINFTRNKRNGALARKKGSKAKGTSFFYKEIVLLTGPNDTTIPRQGTKLYIKQNHNTVRAVKFNKNWSEQQVVEKLKSLFGRKLMNCNLNFSNRCTHNWYLPHYHHVKHSTEQCSTTLLKMILHLPGRRSK